MPATEKQIQHHELIANRYQVDRVLGRGGMAVVYMVYDLSTTQYVALKRMNDRNDAIKQKKVVKLFEREFHTLAHLSHPRVVEVYDYGIDNTLPYYTMELLDGGDLTNLSPVDWRKACSFILDICSALSLLHSRRMVHRDLSPRNIRCSEDGLAKLIDFGAMIPMGPCKQVVGTVSFIAPEVVNLQSIDARTDLYSLGATFYYTLTGRNAYQARDFVQLRNRWRKRPPAPSEIVKDIPKELDNLVMSMIHLDPAIRPPNAAEVMERVSAITDTRIDEQLKVSQAYLSTPTLVGREQQIARVRRRLIRVQKGRGSALLVEGVAGVGRSRFIDACVLEGKLLGATVARVDAANKRSEEYGAVQTLVGQLIDTIPEEALSAIRPRVEILGHVVPELTDRFPKQALCQLDEPSALRPMVQKSLREWILELSRGRSLVIAVDDLHNIDEPSAALIAFLSHKIKSQRMVVIASCERNIHSNSENAIALLSDIGTTIALDNLTAPETEKLLGSVFGEVPNLPLVSDKLFSISKGNPRDVMQLAQHLVDKKKVRFQAGAWTLPERIDTGDLPSTMAQTLRDRVLGLSIEARQLAETMALRPEHSYSFEDCLLLTDHNQSDKMMKSLEQLVTADVLRTDQEHYTLSQPGWVTALRSEPNHTTDSKYHLRLAKMFETCGEEGFRIAQHLLRAGEEARGLAALIDYTKKSTKNSNRDTETYWKLIQSLPAKWLETYEEAIDIGKKLNRPYEQVHLLQVRWANFIWLSDTHNTAYLEELTQQLYQDSGLKFYHELDDSIDAMQRLTRALELAQKRYENRTEQEFIIEPALAIRKLARVIIETHGIIVPSCDFDLLESIPSLQPLVPLSPALLVVEMITRGLTHRMAGRYERARQVYRETLERISQPDRSGLDRNHHKNARLTLVRGMGMIEAAMGLPSALEWAEEFEKESLDKLGAPQIRMMYYLWQGNTDRAKHYKKQMELLKVQSNPIELHKHSFLFRELVSYTLSDNLQGIKSVTGTIERLAKKYPAWVPTLHLARGEYHRIRGDYQGALSELEQAREHTVAGRYQNWTDVIGAYIKTLNELGRYDEAKSFGIQALQQAQETDLGYMNNYIRMPLALTEAKLGNFEEAIKTAQAAIDIFESLGSTGINLGLAYETRARVALLMKDPESYKKYSELCSVQFCQKGKRALVAKYEKLVHDAHDREHGILTYKSSEADGTDRDEAYWERLLFEKLSSCESFSEQALRILEVIVQSSNVSEGYLYTMQQNGPLLSAQIGSGPPLKEINATARNYLLAEIEDSLEVTVTSVGMDSTMRSVTAWTGTNSKTYRPLLIGHHAKEGYAITGLAVLPMAIGNEFRLPYEIVTKISRHLLDSGHVTLHVAKV